jgi:hypothetical protein
LRIAVKWDASDVIRLVGLLGALLLLGLGALMMWKGVSAEGVIDVRSVLISGSLKTGSAGLCIVFLAFLLAVFSIAYPPARRPTNGPITTPSAAKQRGLRRAFAVLLGACVVTGSLGALGYGPGFGALSFGLGLMAAICGIFIVETDG